MRKFMQEYTVIIQSIKDAFEKTGGGKTVESGVVAKKNTRMVIHIIILL